MKKYFYLLLVCLLATPIQQVNARDNIETYRKVPTPMQLAQALGIKGVTSNNDPCSSPSKRTRKIVLDSHSCPKKKKRTRKIVFGSATKKSSRHQRGSANGTTVISFPLYFKSGSYKITSEAEPFIDSIAKLMKKHSNLRFKIEGHTSSRGNARRNLSLSKQRAIAVKNYLVRKHSIKAYRLTTVGKGSREPLRGVSSKSSSNNRIQFRKLG